MGKIVKESPYRDSTKKTKGGKMNKKEAIKYLKKNINLNFAHAVLLDNGNGQYRIEVHSGHAGNCCCNSHLDFIWRETRPYTSVYELAEIEEMLS